jgi:hypothetical protein
MTLGDRIRALVLRGGECERKKPRRSSFGPFDQPLEGASQKVHLSRQVRPTRPSVKDSGVEECITGNTSLAVWKRKTTCRIILVYFVSLPRPPIYQSY